MHIEYDLELQNAVEKIKKENSKLVCIQLPDGLKPRAKEIQQAIDSEKKLFSIPAFKKSGEVTDSNKNRN